MRRRALGARPPVGEVQASGSPGPRPRTTARAYSFRRCTAAPSLETEAEYELVGDPGKVRLRFTRNHWFPAPHPASASHTASAPLTPPRPAQKNGEKRLRSMLTKTPEWNSVRAHAVVLYLAATHTRPSHTVLTRPRAAPDRRALPLGHYLRRAGARANACSWRGHALTHMLRRLGLVATGFRPAQQGLLLAPQDPPDAPGSLLGVRLRPVVPP